jgi:P27 family predicted phage terminase small subunit
MGSRGPIARSASEQLAAGDPRKVGKQKLATMALKETPATAPEMSTSLSAPARKHWRRLVPILIAQNTLQEADGDILACLCENLVALQDWRKTRAKFGAFVKVPGEDRAMSVDKEIEKIESRCLTLARDLGMTWASRARLQKEVPQQAQKQDDLVEMLSKPRAPREAVTVQ